MGHCIIIIIFWTLNFRVDKHWILMQAQDNKMSDMLKM